MVSQGWYEIDFQQKSRGYKIMSHTVDMKNVVGSYKEFFAYCNALETRSVGTSYAGNNLIRFKT